ncbi:SseB family protein [Micromonospora sp. NPDC048930]|uniref:SseB family protein n=1 Tax=Micromonospora sp. NPDC048930 TaxID=3364261 RepID=UPI0037105F27
MTGWEPATEAEVAMRDALRAQDQQLYFRILARVDLLLPVAGPTPAGQAPGGWGTWTTGGRTHVLAFTSVTAMRACLGEKAGGTRRVPYADLAAGWPDHEWWLAVNPGLPIEGYLPAWFVAQLSRGDVRLPGRTMGARARLERVENAARAGVDAPGRDTPPAAAASAGRPPAAPVARVPDPPEEPATVPFPPTRPTVPSVAESPVPPIPRRPEPANGHLTADRLGRLGPGSADEGPPRDGWPGRTTPGDPTRRTGEVAPADRAAPDRSLRKPEPAPDSLAGWVNDLRRHPDEPDPSDGSRRPGTANGRSAAPAPPPARSFFEPASGRSARRPSPLDPPPRSAERAVPPSRFAGGGQPFPRRRPLNEPVPEDTTRAFSLDEAERTQALGPGRPEEPPRPFRPAPPPAAAEEATQALPRRRPRPADLPDAAERTQPIPAGDPAFAGPAEAEELPPPIGEPVSGPPAGRRGFSPIVIEGTIIESRELPEPEETSSDSGPGPAAPEPYAVPTVPSATSAMAAATAPPAYRPRGEAPAAPWAGSAEPTVPLTIDPAGPARPAGESRPEPSGDAGLTRPAADRTLAPAGPDVADSPREGRAGSIFEPAAPPAEPTVPLFGGTAPADRSLFEPATPAEAPSGTAVPTSGTAPAAPAPGEGAGSTPSGNGAAAAVPADFVPANGVEEELLGAAGSGSTDGFLSTLLLARVLLPVAADSAAGSRPGDPGFVWRTEQLDGGTYVVVYTSPERLADRADGPVDTVRVKFVQLIRRWPDVSWSFAVNPGTPVGATYPGEQVLALANWAAEVGLGDDPEGEPEPPAAEATPAAEGRPAPPPVDPTRPVTMQKAIAPSQLAYYLERGYDRVSGFVHRANELAHLNTPAELYDALGLGHPDSPFSRNAEEIYLLRWPAYRPSLYRIPYGGQNEAAMRAMEGWVIERPPFRGNGFAPGESNDVVAEFKVDSARLPHGAQLWRIGADRTERMVAVLDTDALLWRRVGAS